MILSPRIKGLKKVFSCFYPIEACIIKSILEANNIKVTVLDEYFVLMNNFRSLAIGGIKIYVEDASFENAQNIISGYRKETSYKKDYKRIYIMSFVFSIYNALVFFCLILSFLLNLISR